MTTPHRRLMVAALFVAPVLLTASELLRLGVDGAYPETEADPVADAASHLAAVAGNLTAWHVAGFLITLGFVVVWGVALIGMAALLGEKKPAPGAGGVLVAVLAAVGSALHLGFYYLPLGEFATSADTELAARAAALDGHDPLAAVALILFLAGALAPAFFAVGLWRASVLPWWAWSLCSPGSAPPCSAASNSRQPCSTCFSSYRPCPGPPRARPPDPPSAGGTCPSLSSVGLRRRPGPQGPGRRRGRGSNLAA